jgi:antirestriction protein ArdC
LNPFTSGWDKEQYSFEELIAEFTACYLCHKTGITTKTEANSVAYLQGWLSFIKSTPQALLLAAQKAEIAVKYIHGEKPVQKPVLALKGITIHS